MNKPEIPVTHAPSGEDEPAPRGSFRVPLPPGKGWHRTAKWWYLALRRSGQAQFYEVSDWMEAYVAAEILSEMLNAERLSAMLYGAWASHTARLMVTEGDRRRLRIELERGKRADPEAEAAVADIGTWRKKLGTP